MGKQIVVQYQCDKCSKSMTETEFKRTGGATVTIAELRDKRKRSSADLCGDCVQIITADMDLSKAKDTADHRPHLAEVI